MNRQNRGREVSKMSEAALTAMERVKLARRTDRPRVNAYIADLFDDFFELHGDRLAADDAALICGIATFEGLPVTVAGNVKGADMNGSIAVNFGMASPTGYRKFQRVARQAEKFNRPVITFIDTPGASPTAEAEEHGQGEAIARCLFELSDLRVPIIAVITGEGGSGGALALGLADRLIMFENAVYSVLSPEGFASILWKDATRAAEAAEVMKLTSKDLLRMGMVEAVIREPRGGAGANRTAMMRSLRIALRRMMSEVNALDTDMLVSQRYAKYRKF